MPTIGWDSTRDTTEKKKKKTILTSWQRFDPCGTWPDANATGWLHLACSSTILEMCSLVIGAGGCPKSSCSPRQNHVGWDKSVSCPGHTFQGSWPSQGSGRKCSSKSTSSLSQFLMHPATRAGPDGKQPPPPNMHQTCAADHTTPIPVRNSILGSR